MLCTAAGVLSYQSCAAVMIQPVFLLSMLGQRRTEHKDEILNVSIYPAATLFERSLIESEREASFLCVGIHFSSGHISSSGRRVVEYLNGEWHKTVYLYAAS